MTAPRLDLSKIRHSSHDGHLLAEDIVFDMCPVCTNGHINLLGPDGQVFASGYVPPDQFRAVAAKFCEFAEKLEQSGLGHLTKRG